MQAKHTEKVTETIEGFEQNKSINQSQITSPQVKAVAQKTARRKFSKSDKLKFIQQFDACADAPERGAFLRKNGLYYSGIVKWKRELDGKTAHHANSKAYKAMLTNKQLEREVAGLKKQLAQAEAIIDIQKKVSQLLSMSVLNHDESEV